jgi:uncharacterized protein YacL
MWQRQAFYEGSLVLPLLFFEFRPSPIPRILQEDPRRRGLDVVNELQKIPGIHVEIVEFSLKHLRVESVDSGLTAWRRSQCADSDHGLQSEQDRSDTGIRVLNVNDLANALKRCYSQANRS